MSEVLRKKLGEFRNLPSGERKKNFELVAEKVIEQAIAGDGPSQRYIFDRIDGKPAIFQAIFGEALPQMIIETPDEDGDE